MRCLKCGVEIQEPEVFCQNCLSVLAEQPVPIVSVMQIPVRPVTRQAKSSRKPKQIYADYIRSLRNAVRWLCFIVFLLVVLVCALGFYLFWR